MKKDLLGIATLPDDFNNAFSADGWIAYESFSVPVMEKAIDLYNNGDKKQTEKA